MKILLLAILLSLSTLFAQDPQYSLIDVSQGFAEAVAIDINNQGQVVGLGITNLELGFSLAFFWESGNTTIISPGTAIAINDSGWVLVANDQGDSLSLWKNGATISLNPIPSNTYLATLEYGLDEVITADVNNQNIVVASFVDLSGDPVLGYIWQNETWSLLPSPTGFDNHAATKINENNEISGFYWNSSEGIERPLYWQNNMPFSFSFHGYATSLNEDLTLVGGFDSPGQAGGGWKWENFILDTLFTLLPSYDINENSTVIGAGGELYQDGNIYDIESILDSTGNNYSPIYLIGINDADQIAAWANFNNSLRAALLSPKILQLTSPKAGELWIAGEKDTIKWISSQVETIEIELSLDNGNTYETFEILYPASNLQYVWDIPDTLLSRKCKIRITDESATTFSSESDSFKIKGYYLTRVTPAGDYEKFVPNEDGWQFGNSTANLWPPQWWQQFNYTGIDPITNKPYPFQFIGINNFTHPDWQLWVETFGTNQSYWSTILGLYIANSVKRWNSFRGIWGGSCYGFAASSFLGFNYKTEFLNKHPGISNYTNIFELSITDSIRKIINHYYTHQQSQSDANNWAANYNNPPITTLNQIKQMFLSEDTNIRTISLINQQPGGGGHTVAPFKVEEYSNVPGRYRIYVYDSNAPSSDTSFIVVDSTLNTWVDSLGLGWAGQIGLFLEQPITNYLSTPVLPGGDNPIASVRGGSLIEFYAEYNSEYLITNTLGESVGFLQDSVIFDLNEGFPVIPKTGMPHPPIGYYIPVDEYFIYMNEFTDSSAYLTVFGDVTYDYQRRDATDTQTDRFYYNGNFSVSSDDAETKSIELSSVIERDSTEKTIYLENTSISQSDSLDMSIQDYDKLTFKNYGSAKNYDLRSIYAMPGAGAFFFHMDITLTANTSHQIVPDWTDLANTPVAIYVDVGIDGTIDDTLMLKNQITNVDDRGNLNIPKEYKLEQNYPNPFNPSTTIRYSLPKESFVTLKVYNLLGEEVATLINGEQIIGNYEIEFDASDLSSGIYLYSIQAGDFVETKKMILLK